MDPKQQNSSSGDAGRVGRWTRVSLTLQVLLVLLLTAAVAVLAIDASEWRSLRVRMDLTESKRNTLDPQTLELLDKAPAEIEIDVFWRVRPDFYYEVRAQSQARMNELLSLVQSLRPEALKITYHNLQDLATTEERMDELGLDEVNCVVVSLNEKRAVLGLFDEISEVNPGNPDPRNQVPPSLHLFRGEEALAEAIKQVSSTETPVVYFSTGHGELNPFGDEARDLGRLSMELRLQGFELAEWNPTHGPVPADCSALAIVSPDQPFTPLEMGHLREYLESRGRLLAVAEATWTEEAGSVAMLLKEYGMLLKRGLVCVPFYDLTGRLTERSPQCADFRVAKSELNSRHPVTEKLFERDRHLRFINARALDQGVLEGGGLLDLVTSPAEAWLDLPQDGQLDFALNNERESVGKQRMVMAAQRPLNDPTLRIIGSSASNLASNTTFSTNRDFLLNAFNWLTERDFRVGVSPRDPEYNLLDLRGTTHMSVILKVSTLAIPGLCLVFAFLTYWRRRR